VSAAVAAAWASVGPALAEGSPTLVGLTTTGAVMAVACLGSSVGAARRHRRVLRRVTDRSSTAPDPSARRRLAERLEHLRLPPPVRRSIDGLALPWGVEVTVTATALVLAALTAAALVLAGPVAATVVAGAGGASAVGAAVAASGRADRLVDRDLVPMLDRLAAGLRSGASLPGALTEAAAAARGPLRADLDALGGRLAAGVSFPSAVAQWAAARRTPAVGTTVAALVIAHRVGGGAARAVDGVATSLRDRAVVAREVVALSTQARASAVVIVLAPLGFGVVSGAADQQTWSFLTSTPAGLACLGGGVALDLAGGLWMAWLAHRVGRR
jgi:tight adherence protein B